MRSVILYNQPKRRSVFRLRNPSDRTNQLAKIVNSKRFQGLNVFSIYNLVEIIAFSKSANSSIFKCKATTRRSMSQIGRRLAPAILRLCAKFMMALKSLSRWRRPKNSGAFCCCSMSICACWPLFSFFDQNVRFEEEKKCLNQSLARVRRYFQRATA